MDADAHERTLRALSSAGEESVAVTPARRVLQLRPGARVDLAYTLTGQAHNGTDLGERRGRIAVDAAPQPEDLALALVEHGAQIVELAALATLRRLHRTLNRPADPPRCIGRERDVLSPVEPVDGLEQAGVSLSHELGELEPSPLEGAGDGDDETEVGRDRVVSGVLSG
jgi:hypothetical protein